MKVLSGSGLVASIFLLVLANVIFIGYTVVKGRESLKDSITEAKIKRIEVDSKENEEEDQRQEKKRKEEDEFSSKLMISYIYIGLPDDTTNISQDISNTTHHNNTTFTEMNLNKKPSSKAVARDKLKGKDVDYVESTSNNYTTKKSNPTYTTEKGDP